MTNNIEETPFIKMRKQFLKEKDAVIARYEAEIKQLKKRIETLENSGKDSIADIVFSDDLDEPFF